jgi:DNA-binding NarL/FixJ family response regulator
VPAAVKEYEPHVVLMDIRMPGSDGLAATEALRARPGAPEVTVLTTFDADEYVTRALRFGAGGSCSMEMNNRVQIAILVHDAGLG